MLYPAIYCQESDSCTKYVVLRGVFYIKYRQGENMTELEGSLRIIEGNDGTIGLSHVVWVEMPNGEELEMNYLNTCINTYPNGRCDHVEYIGDEGESRRFKFEQLPQSDLEALHEKGYPRFYSPLVPKEVSDWFDEDELEQMLGKPQPARKEHEVEPPQTGAARIQTLGGSALGFAYNRTARIFNAGYREIIKIL